MEVSGQDPPVPPCPPSSLGLRFSLVNDSEGLLCIEEVSGEVHTARPLRGTRPGDVYTVLVEAQYAGMARQPWALWEGEQASDRWRGRTRLPPGTLAGIYSAPGRREGQGLGPASLSENAWPLPHTSDHPPR